MIIFIYTFAIVFIAIVAIMGLGGLIANISSDEEKIVEGEATAAMCTTELLERDVSRDMSCAEDFVVEQDMVYTYDSFNL